VTFYTIAGSKFTTAVKSKPVAECGHTCRLRRKAINPRGVVILTVQNTIFGEQ